MEENVQVNEQLRRLNELRKQGFRDDELIAAFLCKRGQKGGLYDVFRNRVMVPIIDIRGNVIAFGGRVLDDSKPKYVNTSDTPAFKKSRNLFALNFAKATGAKELILCEGYMDVIAMHQAGFTNAVAGLGTAFTEEQIMLLARYCDEITLAFDSDEAGVKATNRALKLLSSSPMKVRVMRVDGGKDPDEIIKTRGRGQMAAIIENAVNDTEFALLQAKAGFDIKTEDGKLNCLNESVNILAGITNEIERDLYTTRLANELEISRESIMAQIKKARARLTRRRENDNFDRDARITSGEDKTLTFNPEKKDNRRACTVEERLLAMLLRHPDYLSKLRGVLSRDVFITAVNRELFSDIARRIHENRSLELSSFGENSTNEELSYLSYLLTLGEQFSYSVEECRQYVQILLTESAKKEVRDMSGVNDADFVEMIKKQAEKEWSTKTGCWYNRPVTDWPKRLAGQCGTNSTSWED